MENPNTEEVSDKNEPVVSPEVIDESKSRIKTWNQYLESDFMKNYDRSHSFKLESHGKELFFFGTTHINDPEDALFDRMKKEFESFEPDMVYIEGRSKENLDFLETSL
jgi:hypothetical protein